MTTVLAPETVIVPGVVVTVDVHDRNDHKLCVAQDGCDVVVLAVVARQVVGQELDYESIISHTRVKRKRQRKKEVLETRHES